MKKIQKDVKNQREAWNGSKLCCRSNLLIDMAAIFPTIISLTIELGTVNPAKKGISIHIHNRHQGLLRKTSKAWQEEIKAKYAKRYCIILSENHFKIKNTWNFSILFRICFEFKYEVKVDPRMKTYIAAVPQEWTDENTNAESTAKLFKIWSTESEASPRKTARSGWKGCSW